MAGSRARRPEALRGSPPAEKLEKVRPQSAALEQWWTMTGWTIAQAIRNPTQLLNRQLGVSEALTEHPSFQNHITNGDRSMPHPFIDAFIPTIEVLEGICSTHPENLPGVRMDGSKHHFFHKIPNANGDRKRRKISNENDYWWHQTGYATKIEDTQQGWKKIFVLKKPCSKAGWTIHQYHLGVDEKEGDDLVLSKVFYKRLPPEPSSPQAPLPNNPILKDHQDDVADALHACSSSMDATIKRFISLIAVPAATDPALPEEEHPLLPELPEWHWQHAGISIADGYVAVPYEHELMQVQHEEVPHGPAEPAVPLDWSPYMDVDVLPVPVSSSPHLDGPLPLTGTDLGRSDELEAQIGSRESLESLLDYYLRNQEP